MEILYTQPGVKYVDEADHKDLLDFYDLMPVNRRWNYASLTPAESSVFSAYFTKDSPVNLFASRKFYERDFKLVTRRRVFKLIRMGSLVDWFSEELGFDVVYIVRHPIPQSMSVARRGHSPRIGDFICDRQYVRAHLTPESRKYAEHVLEHGSTLDQFVVEWCLANLAALSGLNRPRNWLIISYEDMVTQPNHTVRLLAERLVLHDLPAMMKRVATPSRVTDSSTAATRRGIASGDSTYLLEKWRSDVTAGEERRLLRHLSAFGLDTYTVGTSVPNALPLTTT